MDPIIPVVTEAAAPAVAWMWVRIIVAIALIVCFGYAMLDNQEE